MASLNISEAFAGLVVVAIAGNAVENVVGIQLTLVFSPLLVAALLAAVVLAAFISFDGESTWLEGAALVALYVVIATSFWWG